MRYVLTFMMLLVVSFVEASPAPDWVLGRTHLMYDPDQYLIGVGFSKENAVSASESARAELIKSISVKVNSTTKDYNSTDKSFSEATIISKSELLLEGSLIKDGWYDEDKGIFYSLVVIKRQDVVNTIDSLIATIFNKNGLSLRQGERAYKNGDIIKALVYYYDGYIESSKLIPYIQTYNSVIIDPENDEGFQNFQQKFYTANHLLFKERVQNIIDHINLEKVSGSVDHETVSLKVRATYNGRGLDNFPIKFYSVYNNHIEKTFCKSDGCNINVAVKGILNKNNHIFMKAVVDIASFEKFFSYSLDSKLFNHLITLNATYKTVYDREEAITKYNMYKNQQKRNVRQTIERNKRPVNREMANRFTAFKAPQLFSNNQENEIAAAEERVRTNDYHGMRCKRFDINDVICRIEWGIGWKPKLQNRGFS